MKKSLFIFLLSAGTVVQAQQQVKPVNPIQGCWVVENSVNFPKKQTVKFYNDNQQMLYQEYYDQKVLNISKKHIQSMLDSALVVVLKMKNHNQSVTIATTIGHKH